jgi:hypothetical protein
VDDVAFEVVQPRVPDGLGLYLKSTTTGRFYRVEPARHHEQPRFWVLRVLRCQRPGVADESLMPWFGSQQHTLPQLPEALAKIREDVAAWIDDDGQTSLREWLRHCEFVSAEVETENPTKTGFTSAARVAEILFPESLQANSTVVDPVPTGD